MVKVYANLIVNGLKTLEDVPTKLRTQVEDYLVSIGFLPAKSNLWN